MVDSPLFHHQSFAPSHSCRPRCSLPSAAAALPSTNASSPISHANARNHHSDRVSSSTPPQSCHCRNFAGSHPRGNDVDKHQAPPPEQAHRSQYDDINTCVAPSLANKPNFLPSEPQYPRSIDASQAYVIFNPSCESDTSNDAHTLDSPYINDTNDFHDANPTQHLVTASHGSGETTPGTAGGDASRSQHRMIADAGYASQHSRNSSAWSPGPTAGNTANRKLQQRTAGEEAVPHHRHHLVGHQTENRSESKRSPARADWRDGQQPGDKSTPPLRDVSHARLQTQTPRHESSRKAVERGLLELKKAEKALLKLLCFCPVCFERKGTLENLRRHLETCMQDKREQITIWTCSVCRRCDYFDDWEAFLAHIQNAITMGNPIYDATGQLSTAREWLTNYNNRGNAITRQLRGLLEHHSFEPFWVRVTFGWHVSLSWQCIPTVLESKLKLQRVGGLAETEFLENNGKLHCVGCTNLVQCGACNTKQTIIESAMEELLISLQNPPTRQPDSWPDADYADDGAMQSNGRDAPPNREQHYADPPNPPSHHRQLSFSLLQQYNR